MSSHVSNAFASEVSAFFRSAGRSWTTPPEISFSLRAPLISSSSATHCGKGGVCPPGSINRFKKIDGRSVQNARLLHRFFKISRRGKVLGLFRHLSIETEKILAFVATRGMKAPWFWEARRSLHFDMPIEDWTPLAVIPHFVTDNHHPHGSLLLAFARPRADI